MKHYKQLTSEQGYQISGLKKAGFNQSQIADEVDLHKSTISRELSRNKSRRSWHPRQAQKLKAEFKAPDKDYFLGNDALGNLQNRARIVP